MSGQGLFSFEETYGGRSNLMCLLLLRAGAPDMPAGDISTCCCSGDSGALILRAFFSAPSAESERFFFEGDLEAARDSTNATNKCF